MSQRPSGYDRKPNDAYMTPAWPVEALLPHIPRRVKHIWEPSAGTGSVVAVLEEAGYDVTASDCENGGFLKTPLPLRQVDGIAIVTNPPFDQAQAFIERALELMEPARGFVAFLLRVDYDSAVGRRHLFGGCRAFSKKLVLTKRIVWFERPGASPSFNHCWMIWDWRHRGAPMIVYGPGWSGGRSAVAQDAVPPLRRLALRVMSDIAVGDKVLKYTGDYQLAGEVRAVFTTRAGKTRYVVEHDPGFLHIYSEANLRKIDQLKAKR